MHKVMVTDVAAVRALPGAGFAATSTVQSCSEPMSCPVPLPGPSRHRLRKAQEAVNAQLLCLAVSLKHLVLMF